MKMLKKRRSNDRQDRAKEYRDITEKGILALCILLAVFLRLYRLSSVPYGIHQDEAGMGYDAWCLAHYGVDRYLNRYPIYLINYGGGQSALYAYLCAFFVKLAGGTLTVRLMRLPGVLLNLTAYLAGLQIVKRTMGKRWMMAGAFLLAVMPYFVMQGRFGLDCNLLVNMLTISVFLLMWAVEKRRTFWFVLAGLSWGAAYYTYALSYVANTVILLVLMAALLYRDRTLLRKLIAFFIPVFLLGLPLAVMIVINQLGLPQLDLGLFTIPEISGYRGGEISFDGGRILANAGTILLSTLTRDWIDYNAFEGYGTMYPLSIPFILIGFVSLLCHSIDTIKRRKYGFESVWLLVYLVYFFMGLLLGGDGPNINRLNGLMFAQFFILMWGLRTVGGWIGKIWRRGRPVFAGIMLLSYGLMAGSFIRYYFTEYPNDIYPQFIFADTYPEILRHLEENGKLDCPIYIESMNMYYALTTWVSPYDLNVRENGSGFYKNITFGLPEFYEPGTVFIVRETNTVMRDRIEPFARERCRYGMYICYY